PVRRGVDPRGHAPPRRPPRGGDGVREGMSVAATLPSYLEAALADGRLLLECDRLVAAGFAERRASMELRLDALPNHVGYAVVAGIHAFHERLETATVHPDAVAEAAGLLGLGAATVA